MSDKNPDWGFTSQKKKIVPTETKYLTIENIDKVSLIRERKEGTTVVRGSMLAEIEQKCKPGNRSIKVCIFPGALTHNMCDYLKPLLKKYPDNIILHIGTNNLVNETSGGILNGMLSLKNFNENLCPTCKFIVSYIIYQSDNGKGSLTVKKC